MHFNRVMQARDPKAKKKPELPVSILLTRRLAVYMVRPLSQQAVAAFLYAITLNAVVGKQTK